MFSCAHLRVHDSEEKTAFKAGRWHNDDFLDNWTINEGLFVSIRL